MTFPIELQNFARLQSQVANSADDSLLQHSLMNMAIWEPDEEDDDFDGTYGDSEDGHDDLNEPDSDRGVDNLE